MSDPKRDDTATADPSKRTYYARAEWDGLIYKDGEGKERCPSQWHFPCSICHARKTPQEGKASTIGKAGTAGAIVVVELTEDQQSNMEREALEKHDDEGPPEQYVYVRN